MLKKQVEFRGEKYHCDLILRYLQGLNGFTLIRKKEKTLIIEIDFLSLSPGCNVKRLINDLTIVLSLIEKYAEFIEESPEITELTLQKLKDRIENKYWQRNLENIAYESLIESISLPSCILTGFFMTNKFPAIMDISPTPWILFYLIFLSIPHAIILLTLIQITSFSMVYAPRFLFGEQYSPLFRLGKFIDDYKAKSSLSPINQIDIEKEGQTQQEVASLLDHADLLQNSAKASSNQNTLFYNINKKSPKEKVEGHEEVMEDSVRPAMP